MFIFLYPDDTHIPSFNPFCGNMHAGILTMEFLFVFKNTDGYQNRNSYLFSRIQMVIKFKVEKKKLERESV
jgi:hypothetical protein